MSPRRLVTPALALALLTACGTGLNPQTYAEQKSRDFKPVSVGTVDIRNVGIEPPTTGTTYAAGSSLILTGSLVNPGDSDDALVAVSSDETGAGQLLVNGNSVTSVPVPANGDAGTSWAVVLPGLKDPLISGQYITVSMTFEKAGRIDDVSVPVRSGDTGRGTRPADQDPYHSGE